MHPRTLWGRLLENLPTVTLWSALLVGVAVAAWLFAP